MLDIMPYLLVEIQRVRFPPYRPVQFLGSSSDSFNQKLSEQRAETVLNALLQMGIDGSRLTSKGWGESKPLSDNSTPEGKANNRRVEFVKL